MTNSALLRDKIKEKGLKYSFIADQLGLSYFGLKLKIDNESDFRTGEVAKLCDLLGITSLKEKDRIFFAKKCD